MAHVQKPAGTPMPAETGHRGGLRRAGKWCVAAVTAGCAVAVGANPALAADPYPVLVDSSKPRAAIAPGAAGQVKVGLKNTSDVDAWNNGRMYMELWAPQGTRFTEATLTPVNGALGGWSCKGDAGEEGKPYESTVLKCSSGWWGMVAPAGKRAQWQVNMKVYGDTRANTVLPNAGEGGYGAVFYYTHDGRGHWSTMSLEIKTSHAFKSTAGSAGPGHPVAQPGLIPLSALTWPLRLLQQ